MVDPTVQPDPRRAGRQPAATRLQAMPLRWRLLAVTLGLIAVALAVTSLVVSALLRVYLLNQTKQELQVYSASLSSNVRTELQAARPQLATTSAPGVGDVGSGKSGSLGEAAMENNQAEPPPLTPIGPEVVKHTPFEIG